jgi:hypothetical protein
MKNAGKDRRPERIIVKFGRWNLFCGWFRVTATACEYDLCNEVRKGGRASRIDG